MYHTNMSPLHPIPFWKNSVYSIVLEKEKEKKKNNSYQIIRRNGYALWGTTLFYFSSELDFITLISFILLGKSPNEMLKIFFSRATWPREQH